jgi:hypothetical protein
MDLLSIILITSAIFSAIVAWAAGQRGRSPINWFLISLLISPIIALLVLLVAGPGKGTAKTSAHAAPGDLSQLDDADLEIIRQHETAKRTAAAQRRNLPQKLE